MNYVPSQLKEKFDELGYIWPEFHLIGIRSKADKPNAFDDKFYAPFGRAMYTYTGTTNPGGYYLRNPLAKLGCAVIKPGQYVDSWRLGPHRGTYTCWKQAKPITVYRDNDRDEKSENNGIEETGMFGINVHRASSKWISKVIDRWSGGCPNLNNPRQFDQFIDLSRLSGRELFTLTVLEEF